jgi:hypothetical protein
MSRATIDLQSVRFFLGYGLIFLTQTALTLEVSLPAGSTLGPAELVLSAPDGRATRAALWAWLSGPAGTSASAGTRRSLLGLAMATFNQKERASSMKRARHQSRPRFRIRTTLSLWSYETECRNDTVSFASEDGEPLVVAHMRHIDGRHGIIGKNGEFAARRQRPEVPLRQQCRKRTFETAQVERFLFVA